MYIILADRANFSICWKNKDELKAVYIKAGLDDDH